LARKPAWLETFFYNCDKPAVFDLTDLMPVAAAGSLLLFLIFATDSIHLGYIIFQPTIVGKYPVWISYRDLSPSLIRYLTPSALISAAIDRLAARCAARLARFYAGVDERMSGSSLINQIRDRRNLSNSQFIKRSRKQLSNVS